MSSHKTEETPFFTIISPSFNQGRFIRRTIESVISQEFNSFEYVVFDGGSSDETLSVLKAFGNSIHWVSEPDRGQAHAVNKGIKLAKGQVIGWLNSDDIYYQEALQAVHDVFAERPEIEILYGMADHIDENDIIIEPYYNEDWNYDRLKEICYICQPAVFFRKTIVDQFGVLDETLKYCMDYEYWLRIGKVKPFYYLKKRIAGSRLHRETKTMNSAVEVHSEILKMVKTKFGNIPDRWIFAHAHAVANSLGLKRGTPVKELRYVGKLISVSILDSLKLQHYIPLSLFKVMTGWLINGAKNSIKRLISNIFSLDGHLEHINEYSLDKKDLGDDFSRIAVDMTPLRPGGENGGAKLLTIELVRHLSRLAPKSQFVLLTSGQNHEEISFLDGPNVTRFCVVNQGRRKDPGLMIPLRKKVRVRLKKWLSTQTPNSIYSKLKTFYFRISNSKTRGPGILKEIGIDLLFCPFTMPYYYDPQIPVVSVVYDLQYRYYPQFFESDDRMARERNFQEACRLADRLICISEYVHSTVLENSDVSPNKVVSVPIRLFDRLEKPDPKTARVVLKKHGLEVNNFILYPANFWPHKNHSMLFTAFGMFRSCHPDSKLILVCTGAPDERMEILKTTAHKMKLYPWIYLPGFLNDEEFSSFLASCRSLIFPSLYEGFGMPVLEAMAFGKPVFSSNVTSLPEVGGNAIIYFDPRNPKEIVKAFESIEEDSDLLTELTEREKKHIASLGDAVQMASEYLSVFRGVKRQGLGLKKGFYGLYEDGWIGRQATIIYDHSPDPRFLEITLKVPNFHPEKRVSIRIINDEKESSAYSIDRGQSVTIRHPLSPKGGAVTLICNSIFQPGTIGMNTDERWLGCLCENYSIQWQDYQEDLCKKAGEQ